MRVGDVIRKYRAHAELDLRSCARMIGISAPTLMRLEQGRDPSGETLTKVQGWLFGRKEGK